MVEQPTHNPITGETMKFMTTADFTWMAESEPLAVALCLHGLATVCYLVLEVTAKRPSFENDGGSANGSLRRAVTRIDIALPILGASVH